ncbi:tartrate dehydrogenase [Nonomuraea insulae]|uniref:D-malate dehydrogenase (decarboxylating) n=1 Tax=Nonomuraea insulae TaxID=1616787 RepID=A0ABW1CSD7_9ACTN
MKSHRIAVIPGDGIGTEVCRAARAVLDAVGRRHGVDLTYDEFDWSCARYLAEGAMMPANGLDLVRDHDAIFLGAVGAPGVADHVSLWGLLIPIRRGFAQYVNLRPIRVLDGRQAIDLVVVRENVEGEYSEIGGRLYQGTPAEMAVQEAVFTRAGVTRIADYALDLAERRSGSLTSATKSNGIIHTMPFWDEIVAERVAEHGGVTMRSEHIDALCAKLVLDPAQFDVIVASNLFGDILSDLAAAVAGGIGLAPSANIDPTRAHPSMFEPVHGSAPDIAGQGIANPVGAIWTAAMMLDHLGHPEASANIMAALESVFTTTSVRTPDLGGTATTEDLTRTIIEAL